MTTEQPGSSEKDSVTEAVIETLVDSEKRANRMVLIGAPEWVRKIIHLLHAAQITEVRDWSRLMQTRNPNEVISLMQRPKVKK